jgi:hypothetical protein
MRDSRVCGACGLIGEWNDTVPLATVRADLAVIESLDREIADLTAVLRSRLSPEQFVLVWALRDAVERIGIAESLLREGRPAIGTLGHVRTCTCSA